MTERNQTLTDEQIDGLSQEDRDALIRGEEITLDEPAPAAQPPEGGEPAPPQPGEPGQDPSALDVDMDRLDAPPDHAPPENTPAFLQERRKRQAAQEENERLRAQLSEFEQFKEDTKDLLEEISGEGETPPDFDSMTPGEYYRYIQDQNKGMEERIVNSLLERLGGEGFEDEGDLPFHSIEERTPNFVTNFGEDLDEFAEHIHIPEGQVYANIQGEDGIVRQVFDMEAVGAMDEEFIRRFGEKNWNAAYGPRGLITEMRMTDYEGFLNLFSSPDPVGAIGAKFKELASTRLAQPPEAPPAAPPGPPPTEVPFTPAPPPPPADEPPQGLGPTAGHGGPTGHSRKWIPADDLTQEDLDRMDDEEVNEAIRRGGIEV